MLGRKLKLIRNWLVNYRKECRNKKYGITSQKSVLLQARSNAKHAASFVLLLLHWLLISVAWHYPCLFNRTKSCVGKLPVDLSVSASGLVKLSVSAESQYMTFGVVSV